MGFFTSKKKINEKLLDLCSPGDHREEVKKLFLRGVDISTRGFDGETALYRAAKWGNVELVDIVRLLIEKGADVHARAYKGKTAMDAAHTRDTLISSNFLAQLVEGNPWVFR